MLNKLILENKNIKDSWKVMFLHYFSLCETNQKYKSNLNDIEIILTEQLNNTKIIYPPKDKIFAAFEFFEVKDCKIIILGQDPYHKHGQAMGLSFSVPDNIKIPPSLINIYKEINNDKNCKKDNIPLTGNLTNWAKQGVLLLNTALTVEQNKPNIHSKQWELFTNFVIEWISKTITDKQLIFMLWGSHAKKKKKYIKNLDKHIILEANHPSPLSANKGGWFNCGHFGKTSHLINW